MRVHEFKTNRDEYGQIVFHCKDFSANNTELHRTENALKMF